LRSFGVFVPQDDGLYAARVPRGAVQSTQIE
jgi:hypothetical protein